MVDSAAGVAPTRASTGGGVERTTDTEAGPPEADPDGGPPNEVAVAVNVASATREAVPLTVTVAVAVTVDAAVSVAVP